jgi:signal transduction histidine kinase
VVETEQIEIVGDRSRLEASLDALVENAVKFTLDGGQITLRCRSRNGLAVVEVEDDGLGLTRSAEQSGPPHSSGTRGTGLGLSIVRAVVEGHSGTLTLGEVPSGGALVTTTLPLVAPDAADAPPVPRLPGRRPEATRTRA